jgi:hypothetical protein
MYSAKMIEVSPATGAIISQSIFPLRYGFPLLKNRHLLLTFSLTSLDEENFLSEVSI